MNKHLPTFTQWLLDFEGDETPIGAISRSVQADCVAYNLLIESFKDGLERIYSTNPGSAYSYCYAWHQYIDSLHERMENDLNEYAIKAGKKS